MMLSGAGRGSAAAYYPKLLLGHAAAAFWSDAALQADGDAVEFRFNV